MNIPLLISLGIPALFAFLDLFFKKEKIRVILASLIILGLVASYFIAANDAKQNDEMSRATKKTEEELQEARAEISGQSKIINEGFTSLHTQITNAGITDLTILATVQKLDTQVNRLSNVANNYLIQGLEKLRAIRDTAMGVVITPSYLKIPLEEKNSVLLDTKNVITVTNHDQAQNNVSFTFNGAGLTYTPGQQGWFTNDQGKYKTIVYKGIEEGRFVFYMHD